MPFAQSVIVSLQFQFVFLDSQSCNEKELTYFFSGETIALLSVRFASLLTQTAFRLLGGSPEPSHHTEFTELYRIFSASAL